MPIHLSWFALHYRVLEIFCSDEITAPIGRYSVEKILQFLRGDVGVRFLYNLLELFECQHFRVLPIEQLEDLLSSAFRILLLNFLAHCVEEYFECYLVTTAARTRGEETALIVLAASETA